ncbi:MAG: hypothetical protein II375_00120, partial [Bacteroidales bacterium]|nr:hypothetical protein [Bacteroidales bacterium]
MRYTSMIKALAGLAAMLIGGTAFAGGGDTYVPQDYVWTSPSRNSSESMPVGGHSIGLNVWVENGELLIYMCQSGWFDEHNTLLKAGRIRVNTGDDVLAGKDFRQELHLSDGSMTVSCADMKIDIWVDTQTPDIFIQVDGRKKRRVTMSYESWRQKDRPVPFEANMQFTHKWLITPDVVTYADVITPADNSLTFSHVNRDETVFDMTVRMEGLDPIKDKLYNPIGGLKMEGFISSPDLK